MESKVYSKNDILQKLAQDGFFVDYLTLGSFLEKYKIEAIFEDENGSEFYDKSAYDILVRNVLKRTPSSEQTSPVMQQNEQTPPPYQQINQTPPQAQSAQAQPLNTQAPPQSVQTVEPHQLREQPPAPQVQQQIPQTPPQAQQDYIQQPAINDMPYHTPQQEYRQPDAIPARNLHHSESQDTIIDVQPLQQEAHGVQTDTQNTQEEPPSNTIEAYREYQPENNESEKKKNLFENIKWYRWDDVSADLASNVKNDNSIIIDADNANNITDAQIQNTQSEPLTFTTEAQPQIYEDNTQGQELHNEEHPQTKAQQAQEAKYDNEPVMEQQVQTQQDYWGVQNQGEHPQDLSSQPQGSTISEDSRMEINRIMTSNDDEEDFDDIGLLSDSIQAQEKFQKYIVNELAKKNIDVTPPNPQNAFKFDISEKTLNMIARAIAKKIARQVSSLLSGDQKNNTRLLLAEKKSEELEKKVSLLEEQNKKLKLLLVESNKNLNSYKPTFFGLYRFVRRKTKKRK